MNGRIYYEKLAAAYVRGFAERNPLELPETLGKKELEELSENEFKELISFGQAHEMKIYAFKTTHEDMPRVKKIIGFLRSAEFESLLDVGSGRGVFLLPFLDKFPWINVISADILPHRTEFMNDISRGGITNLTAINADICSFRFEEKSVDIVTMLEVLEHIPDVEAAVRSAVKTARKFVAVSVPSKPDNNPEHIHLLTKEKLTEIFFAAGCKRLHFDGVNGHLILIAALEK